MDEQLFSFQSELQPMDATIPIRPHSKLFSGLISKRSYHGKAVDPLFKSHFQSWLNKEIRWRHGDSPELFLGEVRKVWSEDVPNDEYYYAAFEIFGEHKWQKQAQEDIIKSLSEGTPLGLSTNYIIYSESGKPASVFNREISVTPVPKCPTCTIETQISEKEEKTMIDKDANPWDSIGKEAVQLMKSESEELKKKQVETNVLVQELNDKVVNLANEKKTLEEKIQELETKINEKDKTLTEKDEEIQKHKSEAELQTEKMPLITELLTFDKPENDEAKTKLIEDYTNFSTDQLTIMRDKIKAIAEDKAKTEEKDKKISSIPTKADATAEKVEGTTSEETPEDFARRLYPGQFPAPT